ncbi:MAG: N-acetylmuramoyl-L-alanine amidase [Gemmatimonadota bacterium]
MRTPARLTGFLVLLLAGAAPASAQAVASTPATGSRDAARGLAADRRHGYEAVPLGALGAGEEAGAASEPGLGHLRGRRLEVSDGSPFVRYAGRVYQLANPVYRADGALWVPAEALARLPVTGGAPAPSSDPIIRAGRTDTGGPARPARSRHPGPWRVVVDAGHGGHDPGTVDRRTGAREKDITLAVARWLAEDLKRIPNVEPILTREDDRFIGLMDRSRVAIQRDADLFISIHVNAQKRGSSARGFETYFLSEARSERSREVALRENSAIELEGGDARSGLDQLQYILAGIDRDGNVEQSRRFAGYVQNGLRRKVASKDRGVRQAGFLVLVGATGSMPAVLVELGYITNRAEARMMASPAFQRDAAEALSTTIRSYFEETERRLAAMEGRD